MAKKKKSPSKKGFDWEEFDEAVEYFVRRFSGEDVTISPCGFAFRVIPGPGDWKVPQYMVLKDKGWQVWELEANAGAESEGDKVLRTCRSYEQAAIFLEKRILSNKKEDAVAYELMCFRRRSRGRRTRSSSIW